MEQKNVILAVVLSILVLLGFQYFGPQPVPVENQPQAQSGGAESSDVQQPNAGNAGTATTGTADEPDFDVVQPRNDVLELTKRVKISSPVLEGSINLTGARIDDLILPEFKETLDKDSPKIRLLNPRGAENAYYGEFNWWVAKGITGPNSQTEWTADKDSLTPGNPVTLSWTSPEGVLFQIVFGLDENYMFTVTQKVTNNGSDKVVVAPYGRIKRFGTPHSDGFYILHEGFIGLFGEEGLKESTYSDVKDNGKESFEASQNVWLGMTDKFWQMILIPDQAANAKSQFLTKAYKGDFTYQADFITDQTAIAAGGSTEMVSHLFAGAKKAALLDEYVENLNLTLFDRTVDFGMFHFLTKPMYSVIHWLNQYLGNFGLAILALTLIIKVFLLPLAHKSYVSMSRMKLLQPKMQELKDRYGDDRQKLNQEMMGLYKKEKVNPLAGCLPILVQIPIFFSLYKVLLINIEMRHAPFFGWIHDLSAPDPLGVLTGFGMFDWQVTGMLAFLNIGIWPIIMGITMFLQQKLNPAPADPVQAKIFTFMPIMFTFMLGTFPAGLVIYWAWNNLLSIAQQYLIMKKMGVAIGGGKAKES